MDNLNEEDWDEADWDEALISKWYELWVMKLNFYYNFIKSRILKYDSLILKYENILQCYILWFFKVQLK